MFVDLTHNVEYVLKCSCLPYIYIQYDSYPLDCPLYMLSITAQTPQYNTEYEAQTWLNNQWCGGSDTLSTTH